MDLTYSKELLKHFKHPKFVKDIKDASGVGEVGNMKCGDIMHLEIKVDEKTKKIKDIGFKTFGCPAAVASTDVVCGLAKGKTIAQAKALKKDDVIKKLKGMPPMKIHCSVLGIDALGVAIKDYESKK